MKLSPALEFHSRWMGNRNSQKSCAGRMAFSGFAATRRVEEFSTKSALRRRNPCQDDVRFKTCSTTASMTDLGAHNCRSKVLRDIWARKIDESIVSNSNFFPPNAAASTLFHAHADLYSMHRRTFGGCSVPGTVIGRFGASHWAPITVFRYSPLKEVSEIGRNSLKKREKSVYWQGAD